MEERRGSPRLKMYAGVFILHGQDAYLTEVDNVSTGGASVARPTRWAARDGHQCRLYFVLDQETILLLRATVAHVDRRQVGLVFEPGQAIEAEQLVAASRHWR